MSLGGLSLGVGTSLGLLLGFVSLMHPEAAQAEGLPTEFIQDFLVLCHPVNIVSRC